MMLYGLIIKNYLKSSIDSLCVFLLSELSPFLKLVSFENTIMPVNKISQKVFELGT